MARREFTESGIEPGACGPREAETRRWPRHREAVATRRTRYSSVRCVYLILCLDVCPLAHQRLDDRQMTISACHMQRCMPVLIPPPPHTRIRARAHRRRPSGASASPPNARPVACRARPVVPAPTRHSRTQKIKGRPITHTQQARVGARTHMQTRTNRQGEYCGFCVCVFVCVCVCVCVQA